MPLVAMSLETVVTQVKMAHRAMVRQLCVGFRISAAITSPSAMILLIDDIWVNFGQWMLMVSISHHFSEEKEEAEVNLEVLNEKAYCN